MLKSIKNINYFFLLINTLISILSFNKQNLVFFLKNIYTYAYNLLILFTLITIFIFFYKISCIFLLYNYIFTIFVFYFFINTWFYFYNIYKYSKYTSAVQRFWKRTYMLFWLIEFFLFTIYIYLYFISPAEGYYFYSSSNSNFLQNQFLSYDNNIYFMILLSCIFSNLCLFSIKNNNLSFFYILWYFIFISYSIILFFEFYKSMCALLSINRIYFLNSLVKQNILYASININTISLTSSTFSDDIILYRIFTYYNIITIFLKFWHIFFIYIIYVFTTIGFLNKNAVSFDSIAVICQNNIYVFIFSSLLNIFYLKKVLVFFFSDIYFWERNTSSSNFFFITNEFQKNFFL